ncbi:hypothetical protein D3C71_1275790 [compost metagenome]
MNSLRFEVATPAPMQRRPMFHFRVHCAGGVVFDVQAARREDAMEHVRKRNRARIYHVEQFAEVKSHVRQS